MKDWLLIIVVELSVVVVILAPVALASSRARLNALVTMDPLAIIISAAIVQSEDIYVNDGGRVDF